MPSDRAICAVLALRQRQAEQQFATGMSDTTGNAFDTLIGEAIDEAWQRDRARIAIWLRQAELRGRLLQAMRSLEEGRWFTDE